MTTKPERTTSSPSSEWLAWTTLRTFSFQQPCSPQPPWRQPPHHQGTLWQTPASPRYPASLNTFRVIGCDGKGLVGKFTLGGDNLACAQKKYPKLVLYQGYSTGIHNLTTTPLQEGTRRQNFMFARDHTHKTRPPIQKKTQNLKYRQGSSATNHAPSFQTQIK